MKKLLSIWVLAILGLIPPPAISQSFTYQPGISVSTGVVSNQTYTRESKRVKSPANETPGISWDVAYLNTKSLSDNVAFTFGFSGSCWNKSIRTNGLSYLRKDGSAEEFSFLESSQTVNQYAVGIPLRLSFSLVRFRGSAIFFSAGTCLTVPVYNVAKVWGKTNESDSVAFRDQYFPESRPFVYLPAEPAFGYQKSFNNGYLLRIESFVSYRASGLWNSTGNVRIDRFMGIRLGFFFRKD